MGCGKREKYFIVNVFLNFNSVYKLARSDMRGYKGSVVYGQQNFGLVEDG